MVSDTGRSINQMVGEQETIAEGGVDVQRKDRRLERRIICAVEDQFPPLWGHVGPAASEFGRKGHNRVGEHPWCFFWRYKRGQPSSSFTQTVLTLDGAKSYQDQGHCAPGLQR